MARLITYMENGDIDRQERETLLNNLHKAGDQKTPVLGITGTGGAGKSSLTDELIRRFIHEVPDKKIAIISIDPTKRKTGDRKSTRLNSSHVAISYAVFCLK